MGFIGTDRIELGAAQETLLETGTGSPEGVFAAGISSLYFRSDGGASTSIYIKESGAGNTGWVAVSAAGLPTGYNEAAGTVTITDELNVGATTLATGNTNDFAAGSNATAEVFLDSSGSRWKQLRGGVVKFQITGGSGNTDIAVPSYGKLHWSATTDAGTAKDTEIHRSAAGVITIDDSFGGGGALNVGTVTDANAPGDFAAGLTGAQRMDFAQTNGTLILYDASNPAWSFNSNTGLFGLKSTSQLGWTAGHATNSHDVSLIRTAAGVLTVDDGSGGGGALCVGTTALAVAPGGFAAGDATRQMHFNGATGRLQLANSAAGTELLLQNAGNNTIILDASTTVGVVRVFAAGGVEYFKLTGSDVSIHSSSHLGWSATTAGAVADIALKRAGAPGILKLYDPGAATDAALYVRNAADSANLAILWGRAGSSGQLILYDSAGNYRASLDASSGGGLRLCNTSIIDWSSNALGGDAPDVKISRTGTNELAIGKPDGSSRWDFDAANGRIEQHVSSVQKWKLGSDGKLTTLAGGGIDFGVSLTDANSTIDLRLTHIANGTLQIYDPMTTYNATFEVYDSSVTKHIDLTHNGTVGVVSTSGNLDLRPTTGIVSIGDSITRGGIYILDAGGASDIKIVENGGYCDIDATSGFLLKVATTEVARITATSLRGGTGNTFDLGDAGVPWKIGYFGTGVLSPVVLETNTATVGSPNALAASESGKYSSNEGATVMNGQLLPAAVAGLVFPFYVQDADGMRITAGTGDTIRLNGAVSSAAGYAESTDVGAFCLLLAVNATEWVSISNRGAWEIYDGAVSNPATGIQGGFYFSSPANTALGTATPAKAAGTTTAFGTNRGFTHSNNRLTYDGGATKTFTFTMTTSFTASAATTATAHVYVDGSPVTGVELNRLVSNTDEGAWALSGIVSMATDSYIEIWVETDDGDDIQIEAGTFTISSVSSN
jgi:hypothetical protein